jgi:hypothetical protein
MRTHIYRRFKSMCEANFATNMLHSYNHRQTDIQYTYTYILTYIYIIHTYIHIREIE